MKIFFAKVKGFCFGVKRSIEAVEKAIKEKKKNIQILGEIVHNPQQIKKFEEKGVKTIFSPKEAKKGIVFIRAHGVGPDIIKKLKQKQNIEIVDTTCPFVKFGQNCAKKLIREGYKVVIIGEKKHPEAIGILGHTKNKAIIIENIEEAEKLPFFKKLGVVIQTTLIPENVSKIISTLFLKAQELKIYNTICSSTKERQPAARELAKNSDLVLVVGGKNSSNTKRLYEICSEIVKTYHIESAKELKKEWFVNIEKVGITSGASTPDWVTKEVYKKLLEIDKEINKENKIS